MVEGGKGFKSGELGIGRATGLGSHDPSKLFILRARGWGMGEGRASR